MKYYYLYKITNTANNKIYIGVHETNNLDDGYMGSGRYLSNAIKKHGLVKFKKEILEFLPSSEEMYAREAEIVNEEFLKRKDIYNLNLGGTGSWHQVNSSGKNVYGKNGQLGYGGENLHKSVTSERMKQQGRYQEYINKISNSLAAKHASGELVSIFTTNNPMYDPNIIQKVKESYKKIKHQQGTTNSQYGTCWVIHEMFGKKKIKKELLPLYIEQGWYAGASFKFVRQKKKREYVSAEVREKDIRIYREYYRIYQQVSFDEFVKITGYKHSRPNLVQRLSDLLPEFVPQNGKRRVTK